MSILLTIIGVGLCFKGHFIIGFIVVFAGWNWKD